MHEENEIKNLDLTLRRGFIDSRPRRLIINSEFIEFEDKSFGDKRTTRFDKESITDYRFGIKWISGYAFTIGREYLIFVRNNENKIIKISFKSLYGFKKREYQELYSDILNTLYRCFFYDITNDLLTKLHETNDISIGNVRITKEKLTIKVAGILTEESREIPWDKVGVRAYHTYFSIYSTDDPANINHGYSYMDDWNTWVLYNFVHAVLEHNNSEMTE